MSHRYDVDVECYDVKSLQGCYLAFTLMFVRQQL